jgi:hypothetical protein
VTAADLKGNVSGSVFTDSASTIANVLYKQSGSKYKDMDYGYTRPTCQKEIGHIFFDRNLNKNITWDGTGWRDSTGTVVA